MGAKEDQTRHKVENDVGRQAENKKLNVRSELGQRTYRIGRIAELDMYYRLYTNISPDIDVSLCRLFPKQKQTTNTPRFPWICFKYFGPV